MTVEFHGGYNVDNRWTTWIIKWKSMILELQASVILPVIVSASGTLEKCTRAASTRVHPWKTVSLGVTVMARCSFGTSKISKCAFSSCFISLHD